MSEGSSDESLPVQAGAALLAQDLSSASMGPEGDDTRAEILCVYCSQRKARPRKGEHIILKGLGGRATIRAVCGDCNQKLGDKLDIEFLRNSLIAYHRYFDPSVQEGLVGGVQFVPFHLGGFLDARMHNSGALELLPQVAIRGEDFMVVRADEDAEKVERLLGNLKGIEANFATTVRDIDEHAPARLVLNMSGKNHLIRARTSEDVERVKASVRKGYVHPGPVHRFDPSGLSIRLRISTDLNMVGRCAAKMAFNLATEIFGVETMVQARFAAVRAYILGDDVLAGSTTSDDGEPGVIVDQRFVDPWVGVESQVIAGRRSTEHAIELREVRGQLGAEVRLMGGAEIFVVTLGPLVGTERWVLPQALVRREDDDYFVNGHSEISWHEWSTLRPG